MSRLTPAREAEIREAVHIDDSDLDRFGLAIVDVLAELDTAKQTIARQAVTIQQRQDSWHEMHGDLQIALDQQAATEADLAAAQAQLTEVTQERDVLAKDWADLQEVTKQAEATLAAIRASLEILAAENESFHVQATAKGEYPAQTHFAGKLQIIRNLQTLLDASSKETL